VIRLKYALVDFTEWGCRTVFENGAYADAIPHDTHHYHVIAHRLGYGDNILKYTQEHEFCHSFLEERFHDRPSQVLWGVAHQNMLKGPAAAYEEMAVQQFQRWMRANERPIVSGVDWDTLKREAMEMLYESYNHRAHAALSRASLRHQPAQ
jgi:hypothetical protein